MIDFVDFFYVKIIGCLMVLFQQSFFYICIKSDYSLLCDTDNFANYNSISTKLSSIMFFGVINITAFCTSRVNLKGFPINFRSI